MSQIKSVVGNLVVMYCVAWIVAILIALVNAPRCHGPGFTVLWIDGLHTIIHLDSLPGSGC